MISREADKKLDVMIESGHYEREDGEFGDSVRRPDSPSYDALIDRNSNSHSYSKENENRGIAGNGQMSCEIVQAMS